MSENVGSYRKIELTMLLTLWKHWKLTWKQLGIAFVNKTAMVKVNSDNRPK